MPTPRLPYQPPRWLTPERIAVAAAVVAVSGGAIPQLAFWPCLDLAFWPCLEIDRSIRDLVAGLLVGALVRAALRARGTGRALGRAAAFTAIAGAVAALLRTAPLAMVLDHNARTAETLVGYALWAGKPAWIRAGLVIGSLVALVAWRRRRPSYDGPIRMLRDGGIWLLLASGLSLPEWAVLPPPFLLEIAAGLVTTAVALGWLGLRARFVAGLRAAIRMQMAAAPPAPPLSHGGAQPYLDEGTLPYQLGKQDAAYELLVWTPPPSAAAVYRDTDQPVAMALVPIPNQRRRTAAP